MLKVASWTKVIVALTVVLVALPPQAFAGWGGKSPVKVDVKSPVKVEVKPPGKIEVKPPGKIEVKPPGKIEVKPPGKIEVKPPGKIEVKPPVIEVKPPAIEVKPPVKIEVKPEITVDVPKHTFSPTVPKTVIDKLVAVDSIQVADLQVAVRKQLPAKLKEIPFGATIRISNPKEWNWAQVDREKLLKAIDAGEIAVDLDKLDPSQWDWEGFGKKLDPSKIDPAILAYIIDPSGTLTLAYEHERQKKLKEAEKELKEAEQMLADVREETRAYFKALMDKIDSAVAGARKQNSSEEDPLHDFWTALITIDIAAREAAKEIDREVSKQQTTAITDLRAAYDRDKSAVMKDFDAKLLEEFDRQYIAELKEQWKQKEAKLRDANADASEVARWKQAFADAESSPPAEVVSARKQFIADLPKYREAAEEPWKQSLGVAIAEVDAAYAAEAKKAKADVEVQAEGAVSESARLMKASVGKAEAAADEQFKNAEIELAKAKAELAKQKDYRRRFQLPKFDFAGKAIRLPNFPKFSAKPLQPLKIELPALSTGKRKGFAPAKIAVPKFNILGLHQSVGGEQTHDEDGDRPFIRFYGNYGGFGNRGGQPVDKLDAVYKRHDEGYDRHGRFDGKSDAKLLEQTPGALTSGHVSGEGMVKGPIAFFFFADAMPSVYRVKPKGGGGPTLVVPLPNGASAFGLYKSEQAALLLRNPGQLRVEHRRLLDQAKGLRKKLSIDVRPTVPELPMVELKRPKVKIYAPKIDVRVEIPKSVVFDITKPAFSPTVPKINWEQIDLSKINWEQIDLSKINWEQIDLSNINWEQIDLSNINWEQVDLSKISWNQIDLSKISWRQHSGLITSNHAAATPVVGVAMQLTATAPAAPYVAAAIIIVYVGYEIYAANEDSINEFFSKDQSRDRDEADSSPAPPVSNSTPPRPHLKHPASELPTVGERPYVPKKEKGSPELVRNPEGKGFVDDRKNVWVWAEDQHGGPHWDVQHADGTHTNVYPDGRVRGKDNFPNK